MSWRSSANVESLQMAEVSPRTRQRLRPATSTPLQMDLAFVGLCMEPGGTSHRCRRRAWRGEGGVGRWSESIEARQRGGHGEGAG